MTCIPHWGKTSRTAWVTRWRIWFWNASIRIRHVSRVSFSCFRTRGISTATPSLEWIMRGPPTWVCYPGSQWFCSKRDRPFPYPTRREIPWPIRMDFTSRYQRARHCLLWVSLVMEFQQGCRSRLESKGKCTKAQEHRSIPVPLWTGPVTRPIPSLNVTSIASWKRSLENAIAFRHPLSSGKITQKRAAQVTYFATPQSWEEKAGARKGSWMKFLTETIVPLARWLVWKSPFVALVSSSDWPSETSISTFPEYIFDNRQDLSDLKAYQQYQSLLAQNASQDAINRWIKKHFVRLSIFSEIQYTYWKEEVPKYSRADLLSYLGSSLGLWMGISLVTTVCESRSFFPCIIHWKIPQNSSEKSVRISWRCIWHFLTNPRPVLDLPDITKNVGRKCSTLDQSQTPWSRVSWFPIGCRPGLSNSSTSCLLLLTRTHGSC